MVLDFRLQRRNVCIFAVCANPYPPVGTSSSSFLLYCLCECECWDQLRHELASDISWTSLVSRTGHCMLGMPPKLVVWRSSSPGGVLAVWSTPWTTVRIGTSGALSAWGSLFPRLYANYSLSHFDAMAVGPVRLKVPHCWLLRGSVTEVGSWFATSAVLPVPHWMGGWSSTSIYLAMLVACDWCWWCRGFHDHYQFRCRNYYADYYFCHYH